MSKNLKVVQLIAKIGRILSMVVMICCIVGAAGAALSIPIIAIFGNNIISFAGLNIKGIMEMEAGMSIGQMIYVCGTGISLMIGEAIVAGFAARYFKHELEAGTPFTNEGAEEMKVLGIITIVVPIGCSIVSSLAGAIMKAAMGISDATGADFGGTVGLGVMFIILSFVLKHGVELIQTEKAVQAETPVKVEDIAEDPQETEEAKEQE